MATDDSEVPLAASRQGAEAPQFASTCAQTDGSASAKPNSASDQDKTVISRRPPLPVDGPAYSQSLQLLGTSLVGKRLEHYELSEFVGGGGMGAVFRASDTRLGRTVAVKVLSRDQNDEETIRRFRNEAQSAARLDHPNIARVHYVGEDQGLNFIVFEFIEGINLRDHVDRDGPLDIERALYFTLQIAEALSHSSGRDVVHRDIKPSNVLVTTFGQVKLVDMGLARLHQVEASSEDLTASGVTLGTFDYISPEQARDPRDADVRSDIYSLGCTLFFMLTGQPPFPDGTVLQKLLRHNSDEPPDVRSFRPELSPAVSVLIGKILAKRPTQRHQTAAELIADLVRVGQHLGLPSVAEFGNVVLAPQAAVEPWQSKAWQVLAATALLIAAIVGLEVVLLPSEAGGNVLAPPVLRKIDPGASPITEGIPPRLENYTVGSELSAPAGMVPTLASPNLSDAVSSPVNDREGELAAINSTAGSDATLGNPPVLVEGEPSAIALHANGPPAVAIDAATLSLPKRIVVLGTELSPPEPHTEFIASLAEAFARAAETGLNEVELRFNGTMACEPIEIPNQRLTVRAAPGCRPLLLFQAQMRDDDHHLIQLAAGSLAHVSFEGLEFRLELPEDSPSDGWALFGISTGQTLELTDCILTVEDRDAQRLFIHDQVAMVAVQRRRLADAMTMSDPELAMGQQARIDLERTIARGEASLVSLTDETPLTVRWNQGLLVTSKHLIETGGWATEPQYYEQIVLDLDNVTACCGQGLYYLRRSPGNTFQFHVNAYADQCIFVTEPGTALFEMVGVSTLPEADELQSTGEGNRFSPADMPFLYLRSASGAPPQAFKLGRRWSSETRSQAGVPWVSPPRLDGPAHAAQKADFLIEADPLASGAGFDPLLLPDTAPHLR